MRKRRSNSLGTGQELAPLSGSDYIGLRGGIEVCLKNALTGEDIIHDKGNNVVLYIGRNFIMTNMLGTATHSALVPCVVIGSGTAATNATQTGPLAYFTFKTGGIAQTTGGDGSAQPICAFTGSWESSELSAAGHHSIQEFCLAFNSVTNSGSSGALYFNRYLSSAAISCDTTNQLLITFTVSW